jgi:hypothetical protein
MQKPKEIAEIGLALWYLPLQRLAEVRDLVLAIKKECGFPEPTDDSDEWTEEDRRDFQEASLKRWDEQEGTDAAADARAG